MSQQDFTFTLWDVGHGLCIWIQTPNGQNHWIDCKETDEFSPSEHVKDKHGVEILDYLIISNPNIDHISDLPNLVKAFGKPKALQRNRTLPDDEKFKSETLECQTVFKELDTTYTESVKWENSPRNPAVNGGVEAAGRCWPTAKRLSEHCLPEIRRLLTTCDIEGQYKRLLFTKPLLFLQGRASVIAKLIRDHWGITSNVSQMPDPPRWEICATCYETGKNWCFSKKRMSDYLTNYVVAPEFPLAAAAAASAAVPGVIGPLQLETANYRWHKYAKNGSEPTIEVNPITSHLMLWDGGVYENLGVEAMFKPQEGLRDEVDFLITSDASKPLGFETRRFQWGIPSISPAVPADKRCD